MSDCKDLLAGWLRSDRDTLRDRAADIDRQIASCKTEWWPSQLAVLRAAHLAAANVYDLALRTNTPDSRDPS
jgi:hypothetical protein